MSNIIVFDTETGGFLNKGSSHEDRVRLVQLGMIKFDKDGNEIDRYDQLALQSKPIPEDAIKIHGKTDSMCREKGIPPFEIINAFKEWCEDADTLVAHNASYDVDFIMSEAEIEGVELKLPKQIICTKQMYHNICKFPPTQKMIAAGRGDSFKPPKLEEAYHMLFKEKFENAHDAFADVRATAAIYFEFFKRNMLKQFPNALKEAELFLATKPQEDLGDLVIVEGEKINGKSPENIFSNEGYEMIVKLCEAQISAFHIPSLTTKKGQSELISFASKFRKSKAPIKKIFENYIADLEKPIIETQKKIKNVKAEFERIEAHLEEKYKEVREPVTKLEDAEKERKNNISAKLNDMKSIRTVTARTSADIQALFERLKTFEDFNFEELQSDANAEYQEIQKHLNSTLEIIQLAEKATAEQNNIAPLASYTNITANNIHTPVGAPPSFHTSTLDKDKIREDLITELMMTYRMLPAHARALVQDIEAGDIPSLRISYSVMAA